MPIENEIKLVLAEGFAPSRLHVVVGGLEPHATYEIEQAYLTGTASVEMIRGSAWLQFMPDGINEGFRKTLQIEDRDALFERAGGQSEGNSTILPSRSARIRRQVEGGDAEHVFAFKIMTARGLIEIEMPIRDGLFDQMRASTDRSVAKTRSVYLHAASGLKVEADAIRHPGLRPTLDVAEIEYLHEGQLAPVLADMSRAWLIYVEAGDRRFDNQALADPDHLAAMIALTRAMEPAA